MVYIMVYILNNLSNLWISAYWRRKPFQTIQFDLVNWFDWFTLEQFFLEPDITSKQAALPL